MLSLIYYSTGFFVVLSILSSLIRFKKLYSIREWVEKYDKVTGKKPLKSEFRTKKEYSLFESNNFLLLFETIWVIIGLFTCNWYIFLSLMISSFLLNILIKPMRWTLFYKIFLFSFLLSKMFLYLYLILNSY
jgi:hypothetical protein